MRRDSLDGSRAEEQRGTTWARKGQKDSHDTQNSSSQTQPYLPISHHCVYRNMTKSEEGTYRRTEIGICTSQAECSMGDTPSVYRHYPCQGDEEHREPLFISSRSKGDSVRTNGGGDGRLRGRGRGRGQGRLTEQKRKN